MPLESASYVSDLVPANPASTDLLDQADNHIRLIKQVLKATFPNLAGAVTASHTTLSQAAPIGLIALWYGSSGTVPTGWAICNGQTVARTDGAGNITTPNLTDKFVVGAGTIAAQGATAGAATDTATTVAAGSHTHTGTVGSHTHTATIGGTALTEAQLPAHRHLNGVVDGQTTEIFNRGTTAASPSTGWDIGSNAGAGANEGYTANTGGGETHTHTITINSATATPALDSVADHTHNVTIDTIPPCMGLYYVMKV